MKKNISKIFAVATLVLIAVFAIAPAVYAQGSGFTPLTNVPGIFDNSKPTNPIEVLRGFYGLAIGIGAVLAVVIIILAGFKYMYEESIFGKSSAREQITNAFIGLAVILGSYILLRTINTNLVNFDLSLPGGTGRIQGLVASQAQTDAENKRQLNLLVKEVSELRKEAEQSKGHFDLLSSQLVAYQKDYDAKCKTINTSNERLCTDMKNSIDETVRARKTAEESYIESASIASLKASQALSGISLDDKISQKISAELIGGGVDKNGKQTGNKTPGEIFSDYAKNDITRNSTLINQELEKTESLPESEVSNNTATQIYGLIGTANASKSFYEKAATIDIYAVDKITSSYTGIGTAPAIHKSSGGVDGSKLNEAATQLSNIYNEATKNAGDNEAVKAQITKDYNNALKAMQLYVNSSQGNKACEQEQNKDNIFCKN